MRTWIVSVALLASPVGAGDEPSRKMLDQLQELRGDGQRIVPRACVLASIQCGQTVFGSLDLGDCNVESGYYADFWVFSGQVGQTVTIDAGSTEFDTFLTLHTPSPGSSILAQDDDSGTGLNSRLSAVLTQTSNGWGIGVSNISSTPFDVGSYFVTLTCSGANQPSPTPTRTSTPQGPAPTATPSATPGENTMPCVRGPQKACLLDDRFEVMVAMQNFAATPTPFPGFIQEYQGASSETEQSVSFYSFENGNVEVFVKMVNACPTASPAFWLFAAGATNARTVITVRDTHTGETRTITNPSGQLFQTYANTAAFATCDE